VDGSDGVDSIFQFQLERGGDVTKSCRKMKQKQRARLASVGRKCDTTQRRDDVGHWRGKH
jgi:hypothetical protein